MKLKIILSVLLLFSLLKVDANSLANKSIASGRVAVFLYSNDIPFEILTTGKEDGSRSVVPLVPCDLFFFREYFISPSEIFATSFWSIRGVLYRN